uniref:FERM domain-containing protein n=1 Tax=Glossina austeni TaxID=7395 RepID=A0A1A9V2N3_GLOAU
MVEKRGEEKGKDDTNMSLAAIMHAMQPGQQQKETGQEQMKQEMVLKIDKRRETAASLKKICLNIYWPNNTHQAVSIDDQTETVQDVIEKTIALVPTAQKPNFKYYALRLQNMITKETLWMNKTSKIQKLLIHIWNATCPNTECPQLQKNILLEKPLNINDNLSIWRPELRIRYLPNSIEELHAEDKITCHFYFDQVCMFIIAIYPFLLQK